MRCPFCQNEDTQVRDSRPTEDGASIRRRRQCPACGARFTTFERAQLRELVVVKRSGRRAPFEREKLARSVAIALRKRQVDADRVEKLISGIIRRLEASGETEIPSDMIGNLIMAALKRLDPVAYVRYASVYKDFQDAKDFQEFLDGQMSFDEETDELDFADKDAK
jgi:transcriptional repressor NrdR